MNPPVEIHDGFKDDLNPSERSESMSTILSQFEERMLDSNKRILSRILDLIAETEPEEQVRLDMLATHLAKETSEVLEVTTWPGDNEEYRGITRLSEFMAQTGSGGETGVCPWKYTPDGRNMQGDWIADFLQSLEKAVRENASRELLGSAAENLELPAEYREFLQQTHGVVYENWDREMFVCDFGNMLPSADRKVQPLNKMCESVDTDGFEVAAGWKAGDNDQNCWVYYLLCKDKEESDEPWQWRVFFANINAQEFDYFDSLNEFLGWYASGYDWVDWNAVKGSVEELQQKCQRA